MWYCVVGQVVPDNAKDHTAFIFRVKHFFLHYLTLTLKAPYTIKMTGTVTSPKDLNLFWNYLFDLATVIYVIIYGPLLNPPGFIWTVYYCKLQFNVSLNWSSFLFSPNMQYRVNVSTHLQFIIRAGVSDTSVYHSHRPQAPHNTVCERLLEATHTRCERNKQNDSYSSVEFL
jgi:hypothetical protein